MEAIEKIKQAAHWLFPLKARRQEIIRRIREIEDGARIIEANMRELKKITVDGELRWLSREDLDAEQKRRDECGPDKDLDGKESDHDGVIGLSR